MKKVSKAQCDSFLIHTFTFLFSKCIIFLLCGFYIYIYILYANPCISVLGVVWFAKAECQPLKVFGVPLLFWFKSKVVDTQKQNLWLAVEKRNLCKLTLIIRTALRMSRMPSYTRRDASMNSFSSTGWEECAPKASTADSICSVNRGITEERNKQKVVWGKDVKEISPKYKRRRINFASHPTFKDWTSLLNPRKRACEAPRWRISAFLLDLNFFTTSSVVFL